MTMVLDIASSTNFPLSSLMIPSSISFFFSAFSLLFLCSSALVTWCKIFVFHHKNKLTHVERNKNKIKNWDLFWSQAMSVLMMEMSKKNPPPWQHSSRRRTPWGSRRRRRHTSRSRRPPPWCRPREAGSSVWRPWWWTWPGRSSRTGWLWPGPGSPII